MFNHINSLGTFQLDKPNCQLETIQVYLKEVMCKLKKCAKSIMEHQYVWNNKIHYLYIIFLENVICFHLYLLNGIHTNYVPKVIGSYIFIVGNQLWTGGFVT